MQTVELERFQYHVAEDPEQISPVEPAEVMRGLTTSPAAFKTPEACARFFLNRMINSNGEEQLKCALHKTRSPINLRSVRRLGNSILVRFGQKFEGVPVFGAEALVELDDRNRLISVRWTLGSVDLDVITEPELSEVDASERLTYAIKEELDIEGINSPELQLFCGHDRKWRLVWHFFDVPAFPHIPDVSDGSEPRSGLPSSDFLVDAHSGDIIFAYGKALSISPPSPAELMGSCEEDVRRQITGSQAGREYRLHDVTRRLSTHDRQFGAAGNEVGRPVSSQTVDLGDSRKGAVSAHYNATLVGDFYRKYGFTDMLPAEIVCVVNCRDPLYSTGLEWRNAVWWKGKVWYGQVYSTSGRLVSVARFLDLVAHEITHGVISATSGLIYAEDGGALDESFSDVFGVIIKNCHESKNPQDLASWDWSIGKGFAENGDCLRDMSNPARLKYPCHLTGRLHLPHDYDREAHANSCIPSKAVHNAMISSVPDVGVDDWIAILAKTMGSLHSTARFADVPILLKESAFTHIGISRRGVIDAVWLAIDEAYRSVGIEISNLPQVSPLRA